MIDLRPYLDVLVRQGASTVAIERELHAAAREVSERHLGKEPPLRARLHPDYGFLQPMRPVLPDGAEWSPLEFWNAGGNVQDEKLQHLEAALAEVESAFLRRHFPLPLPPGSLAELLSQDASWLRMVQASVGDVQVTLVRPVFDVHPRDGWPKALKAGLPPCLSWSFELGVELEIRTPSGTRTVRPRKPVPWQEVERRYHAPVAPQSVPHVREALERIAREAAAESSDERSWQAHVLEALLARPSPKSAWIWGANELRGLVGHPPFRASDGRVEVELTFQSVSVRHSFEGWGDAFAELEGRRRNVKSGVAEEIKRTVYIGSFSPTMMKDFVPAMEIERGVDRVIERFLWMCQQHLSWQARTKGLEELDERLAAWVCPANLVEQVVLHGPPGELPCPPLHVADFERAARSLRPMAARDAAKLWKELAEENHVEGQMLAAFTAGEDVICFTGDLHREPGLVGDIWVRAEGRLVPVLTTDVLDGGRTCVDDDSFALRRFVTWLRGGLIAGGHDRVLTFVSEDEDEDGKRPRWRLALSEWLLFGRPYFGDASWVDWRRQLDIVSALTVDVDPQEVAVYRRFLARHVHPALGPR